MVSDTKPKRKRPAQKAILEEDIEEDPAVVAGRRARAADPSADDDYDVGALSHELRNDRIRELVREELQIAVSNNKWLDRIIFNISRRYSMDQHRNITLVSIEEHFSQKINLADYNFIVSCLLIATEIAEQFGDKVIKASLAVCDPLPFTKFFIDIDCVHCKSESKPGYIPNPNHYSRAHHNGMNTVRLIADTVNKIFTTTSPVQHSPMMHSQSSQHSNSSSRDHNNEVKFIVATKSSKPWCGIHLYFMVNVDVVMKRLLFNCLLNLNEQLMVHQIDVTTNGVLPFCRYYDRFYDHKFNVIKPSADVMHSVRHIPTYTHTHTHTYVYMHVILYFCILQISYIDVWNNHQSMYYYICPLNGGDFPDEDLEAICEDFIIEDARMFDESSQDSNLALKKSRLDIFNLSLFNGSSKLTDVSFSLMNKMLPSNSTIKSTYTYLMHKFPGITQFSFSNAPGSTPLFVTAADIELFLKGSQATIVDNIISLKRIEEYYQQNVPILSNRYTQPTLEFPVSTVNTLINECVITSNDNNDNNKTTFDIPMPTCFASETHDFIENFASTQSTLQPGQEYIPLTDVDRKIITAIINNSPNVNNTYIQMCQTLYEKLSKYDIVISFIGLGGNLPPQLIEICNTEDDKEEVAITDKTASLALQPQLALVPAHASLVPARASSPQPGTSAEARAAAGSASPSEPKRAKKPKGKTTDKIPLPSANYLNKKFKNYSSEIYNMFLQLVKNALLHDYCVSLVSLFRRETEISSNEIITVLISLTMYYWNNHTDVHTNLRKNLKILVGLYRMSVDFRDSMLTALYNGCELFYAAWRFELTVEPQDIFSEMCAVVKAKGLNPNTELFKSHACSAIFGVSRMGDSKILYFDGKGRVVAEPASAANALSFLGPKVDKWDTPPAVTCNNKCFAYYSSMGVVHANLHIVEKPGPFLTVRLYRKFGSNISLPFLYPNKAIYCYIRDIFFKVPHYISMMTNNLIGLILLGPVVNNLIPAHEFQKNYHQPVIDAINIKVSDLTYAYSKVWSRDFMDDIVKLTDSHTLCGILWNNFLSLMGTIDQNAFIKSDPMNFLVIMFGSSFKLIGSREYFFKSNDTVSFVGRSDTNNAPDVPKIEPTFTDLPEFDGSGYLSQFFERVCNIVNTRRSDWSEKVRPAVDSLSTTSNLVLDKSYKRTKCRRMVNQSLFAEYMSGANFKFDASDPPDPINTSTLEPDFIKLSFLIFSWLLRMGDTHNYTDSPLMMQIMEHRPAIYKEFSELVLKHFNIEYVNTCADQHTKTFREYCESITLDYSNLSLVDKHEVPDYVKVRSDNDLSYKNDTLNINESELHDIYSAFSYLIIYSNFESDVFVEICKLISSIEFCGNFLKKMYLFYGKSMGGKNIFVENLRKVFYCSDKIRLHGKHYGDSTQDFNPNIPILGTSMLVNLDEPPNKLRPAEIKQDVNIGNLSTRLLYSRDTEEYCIMAKMIITSNVCVGPSTPDAGWFKRLMLFHVTHSFAEVREKIFRKTSHSSGEVEPYTTKYLVCQILQSCYPDHDNASGLIRGLTIASYTLFRRLFYFKDAMPVSGTISGKTRSLLFSYMMTFSPLFAFLNSVTIVPSPQPLSNKDVSDYISNWASVHKCGNNKISIEKAVKDCLQQFYQGGKYYVRLSDNKE